jgi:Protein of unknown function with HXXEE motif
MTTTALEPLATPLGRRYWMLALVQAAHSMEEVLEGLPEFGRTVARPRGLPAPTFDDATFAAVNLGLVASLLAVAPFVAAGRGWARGVAGIVAVVEVVNGLAHLSESALLGRYVPGSVTAPLLLVLGGAVLHALLRNRPPGTR